MDYRIYPSIGIARVENSPTEFLLARKPLNIQALRLTMQAQKQWLLPARMAHSELKARVFLPFPDHRKLKNIYVD